MANASHSAFSQDGEFLAVCGIDGKLRIWETATSRLKQEFIPNLHLSSPCSVLGWITVGTSSVTAATPWKKRRKKSINEDADHKQIVAMGSMNGTITLYDISTSSINNQLENGHGSTVTALTWSENSALFTASEDKHIVEWNLQEKSVKCKWKSGKGKITSLTILPEGKSLLSGDRIIKWWDLESKQIISTFTAHASQVNALSCVQITNEACYLFSSASGDNYLSIWSLNEVEKEKAPIATLTLPDEAVSFSIKATPDKQINVLSVTRSGHAQLFKYDTNETYLKPLKSALNVLVAADTGQKESVQQIPILIAKLTSNDRMLLAYGSFSGLSIEKVVPDFSDKVQCLIRTDLKTPTKAKKEESVTKVKKVDTEENVEYLPPGSEEATAAIKRTKSGTGSQLPLKIRLENLSLNAETSSPGKTTSKGQNMTQLLIQALHSEDKNLLTTVLYTKKENVIKNTVAKLPVQAIIPLLKELTKMLEGKTYPCKIAVMWLQALVLTHAAQMISHPNIREALGPIISLIDAKTAILPDLTKLQGKVALITGQIAQRTEQEEKDITDECLLVYEDQDSSDEDIDINKVELDNESDDNWEETSDQEHMQEDLENGKSDEYICSGSD